MLRKILFTLFAFMLALPLAGVAFADASAPAEFGASLAVATSVNEPKAVADLFTTTGALSDMISAPAHSAADDHLAISLNPAGIMTAPADGSAIPAIVSTAPLKFLGAFANALANSNAAADLSQDMSNHYASSSTRAEMIIIMAASAPALHKSVAV